MDESKSVGEPLRIRKFEVGDLVFAKLKGYPPWPSKINQIESIIWGGKEKIRYNVYFYGTHQSSIMRDTGLVHYDTHAKQIVEKWGPKPKFHDALQELEREMVDKMTYLSQLRTTNNTPESQWCNGFNSACGSLVSAFNGVNKAQTKSKSHRKSRSSRAYGDDIEDDIEDEITEESRRLGYEVMYIDRIPFPDTPEALIIMSLSFNKDWVKEEAEKIKEEERMANCFVRIEPFPPQYAHLDPHLHLKHHKVSETEVEPRTSSKLLKTETAPRTRSSQLMKTEGADVKKEEVQIINDPILIKDTSDGSDEEVLETCPVCRLCFFSVAELKDHEKTVHGSVSTAESMFDRLISSRSTVGHSFSTVPVFKEGYPLDTIMKHDM